MGPCISKELPIAEMVDEGINFTDEPKETKELSNNEKLMLDFENNLLTNYSLEIEESWQEMSEITSDSVTKIIDSYMEIFKDKSVFKKFENLKLSFKTATKHNVFDGIVCSSDESFENIFFLLKIKEIGKKFDLIVNHYKYKIKKEFKEKIEKAKSNLKIGIALVTTSSALLLLTPVGPIAASFLIGSLSASGACVIIDASEIDENNNKQKAGELIMKDKSLFSAYTINKFVKKGYAKKIGERFVVLN
jgi:hypothetical protein